MCCGCQLSGWGTQAWLPRGTGNLRPLTGDKTTWPVLEGRFLTAGPPGTGKGIFFRHKKSFQPRTANITLRKNKVGGLRSAGRCGADEEADKQVSGDEQGARNGATRILTKQPRKESRCNKWCWDDWTLTGRTSESQHRCLTKLN